MAFDKRTKQIGGFTYEVTQLGAKVGSRVLMKAAKSLGPMFLLAAAGGRGLGMAQIVQSVRDMNEDDFDWVVAQFAASTDVTLANGNAPSLGNAAVFDQHFAGRYAELGEWLEFAIEVNFGPFFLALKAKAAAKAAVTTHAPSSSTSPPT